MPSEDIDWTGIRAASGVVGVREAARQASSNLTKEEQDRFVFRVLKRSQREGWVVATELAKSRVVPVQVKPMSSSVLTGADLLSKCLTEDGNATKQAAMRYAKLTSQHAARMAEDSPEKALAVAGDVKSVLQSAALAGGWSAGTQTQGITVQLLNQITVEHE